nr:ATP-binding protein [uncultured Ruminococcus sp.]
MVFFISDLHFYHFNIIKSCSRPFRDEIEMNEKLIENFNSTVSENDEVYILGDLAYRYPDIQSVNSCIARLSGIKHLVVGNHDIELLKDPLSDEITFIDNGKQYDPLAKPDPDITLSAKQRKKGGLGIFMVKNSMDDVRYEYRDGKNILTIKKNLN